MVLIHFLRLSVIILFFSYGAGPLMADQNLNLNTATLPPLHNPQQTGMIDLMVQRAFSGVGKNVYLQYLPPERALLNANLGIEDGEAARTSGLSEKYSHLRQVPIKIFHSNFMVFTRMQDISISGWQDLKFYNVAIIRGDKMSEAKLTTTRSLMMVENTELLFTLLKNNRVDLVLCEYFIGKHMAKQLRIDDVRVLDPPLAEEDFYIYLHKKHEPLITALSEAIDKMHQDGTYARIYLQGIADAGY